MNRPTYLQTLVLKIALLQSEKTMSNDIIEIYTGIVSTLPPPDVEGFITFVGSNEIDRTKNMREAVDQLMGSWDVAADLYASLRNYKFLIEVFLIDEKTTTIPNFYSAVFRAVEAGKLRIGPIVHDAWVGLLAKAPQSEHRALYGFMLMDKPDITLAEYTRNMKDDLAASVEAAAPHVKELVQRIASEGFCWPGPIAMHPANIGMFADFTGRFTHVVVVNWSTCITNVPPFESIMEPLLKNYKEYLAEMDIPLCKKLAKEFVEIMSVVTPDELLITQ